MEKFGAWDDRNYQLTKEDVDLLEEEGREKYYKGTELENGRYKNGGRRLAG